MHTSNKVKTIMHIKVKCSWKSIYGANISSYAVQLSTTQNMKASEVMPHRWRVSWSASGQHAQTGSCAESRSETAHIIISVHKPRETHSL